MRGRELIGKPVLGSEGHRVGKVTNILVDRNAWRVTKLEVELDNDVAKDYGMKKALRKTFVPMDVTEVRTIGDAVILAGPKLVSRAPSKTGKSKDETSSKKASK